MDFISKLLQRKPNKSGGGSNGQSSFVGVPVDHSTVDTRENADCGPTGKSSESLPELSEKTLTSASEDLEVIKQSQDSSKFPSVDSYISLPDLLLPEAAYKKQSDTDTDTAEYESAADTYESATETDLSEAVTPSEKYTSQVFEEPIKVPETPAPIDLNDSSVISSKDFSHHKESINEVTFNVECEFDNEACIEDEESKLKECSYSVKGDDVEQLHDSAIVSDQNQVLPAIDQTILTDLSLCEAFSQLSLSSPQSRNSVHHEAVVCDKTETLSKPKKNDIQQFPSYETPDTSALSETNCLTSVLQNDGVLLENKFESNKDLGNDDETAQSISGSVELQLESEQSSLHSQVKVPGEEEFQISSIPALNETLPHIDIAEEKTHSPNIPKEPLPYLDTTYELEPVPSDSVSECPSPSEERFPEIGSGIPPGLGLENVEKQENDTACIIIETSTNCIFNQQSVSEETRSQHTVTNNETVIPPNSALQDNSLTSDIVKGDICGLSGEPVQIPIEVSVPEEPEICALNVSERSFTKSETVVETCNFPINSAILPEIEAIPQTTPVNILNNLCLSELKDQEHTSNLPVLSVVDIEANGLQSGRGNLASFTDLPTKLSSLVVDSTNDRIHPADATGLEVSGEEIQRKGAENLDQLIEICNRQQENLNRVQFVQETLTQLDSTDRDSCEKFKAIGIESTERESSIPSVPLLQEENFGAAGNEELQFDDIALEASKIADSFLHSTHDIDLDSESENLSTVSLKMADSEEFSAVNTGSPAQPKAPCHMPPQAEKVSKCSAAVLGVNFMKAPSNDASRSSPLDLSSNEKTDGSKTLPQKFGSSEVNQSEAGPDIADLHCKTEEVYWLLLMNRSKLADVFKDSSAFDFLSAIGSTQSAQDLRKQSLYVNFDPLVESMSETERNKVSSQTSETCRQQISSVPASAGSKALELVEKLISVTPTPKRRDPEIVVKRSSASVPKELFPVKKEEVVVEVSKAEEQRDSKENTNEEVLHLREELERLKQHMIEETEIREKTIEEMKTLLRDSEAARRNVERLLTEKSQSLSQMSIILEEYEKTISRMVAEKEHEKQALDVEITRLTKEKDTMSTHLENIEIAFSDVHQKYEKSKQVIQGFVKNEDALRASLAKYDSTIKKQEQKYEALKNHAMAQLEGANEELNMLHRNHQVELTKLRAMLKKAELKVTSLEEVVEQKTKENQELVTICDELIGNVEPK